MTNKKLLLLLFCSWHLDIYTMEQTGKEDTTNNEFCLESLLHSFDQFELNQQNHHVIKENHEHNEPKALADLCWANIKKKQNKAAVCDAVEQYRQNHQPGPLFNIISRALKKENPERVVFFTSLMPVQFYPKIAFKVVKSGRFTDVQKEKMITSLYWTQPHDKDTKKILKFFIAHCHNPSEFNKMFDDNADENEFLMQNLSWRALLDTKTDIPCKFLFERKNKKFKVPKKVMNYLLHERLLLSSAKFAQQILQRVNFVLERGALVDTSTRPDCYNSFNYVLRNAQICANSGLVYTEFRALFFKNVLTLFVVHLIKREDNLLFIDSMKNYKRSPLNQIVERLIESDCERPELLSSFGK